MTGIITLTKLLQNTALTYICKPLIIFTVCLALFTGCTPENARAPQELGTDNRLATPRGLIEDLQTLPAVKKVEIWQNSFGPGIIITTWHYQIHTTLLDPLMLRQVPGFIEAAYAAYQSQLPKPIETTTKSTVYLFADRAQWEEFTETFAGRNAHMYLKIKKGAYYLNGACVTYNIGRTSTFSVLGHEAWHQFNSKHFTYRLPSWLDEGIATLFETSDYKQGKFQFAPQRNGGRLGALRQTVLNNKMIPLAQLITLNPGEVVTETDAVMAFYSQSYALVRFLREDDYGIRMANYQNLLLGAVRGTWPMDPTLQKIAADRNIPLTVGWNRSVSPDLFALYIDGDIEKIEGQYVNYCKKIIYHVRLKK